MDFLSNMLYVELLMSVKFMHSVYLCVYLLHIMDAN